MAAHVHEQKVPRAAILGAAALMTFSTVVAAAARASHKAESAVRVTPTEAIDIRFEDRPDGSLAVLAERGVELQLLAPGTNGFIRGVLRGMFRERKLESMGQDATFLLAREADGRLSLEDRQSGRKIDLSSFGPTNEEAFAAVLEAGKRVP